MSSEGRDDVRVDTYFSLSDNGRMPSVTAW